MNDFKKGLLVGMLVMMGCMFFMAMRDVPSQNGRFELLVHPASGAFTSSTELFDTQTGNVYKHIDIPNKGRIWSLIVSGGGE
jgi:hypothetical protein